MTTPTRAERDEMRALLAKATPGPWAAEHEDGTVWSVTSPDNDDDDIAEIIWTTGHGTRNETHARLVAMLRNRAEALLDELDRAEATIARLTAEVTEEECIAARVAANPYARDGDGMQAALTAFLASRKGD